MKKVFIAGCNGLLGQKVADLFAEDRFMVYGADIHPENLAPMNSEQFTYFQIDLTDKKSSRQLLEKVAPHCIVNAAAMTNVDGCERDPQSCQRINIDLVSNLVQSAEKLDAHLVHISTDYVFDGMNGPYTEEDTVNPLSVYGKSKLESEAIVLNSIILGTILRTVVLFGHGENLKKDFVAWVVGELKNQNQVRIVDDQIGNVTLVDDLANAVVQAVKLRQGGVYHVAGKDILDRYRFTQKIAAAYNLDPSLISPIKTKELNQDAPRPLDGGLIVDKAERDLKIRLRTAEEAIEEYQRQESSNS
ncbi:dTDP-4-dehydrorhamnose reductase [bacterium]|nr:dTDP-4-dehydrorhamnose reductase [bacterium]